MSLDEQLVRVKKEIETIKVKKIQLAERLNALGLEKDQLIEECRVLEVDPQKIAEALLTHEQNLSSDLNELSQTLTHLNQGMPV